MSHPERADQRRGVALGRFALAEVAGTVNLRIGSEHIDVALDNPALRVIIARIQNACACTSIG